MKNKIIFAGLGFAVFMGVVFTASAATTTPTIKVISPNGGEVWKAGTKKNIVFNGNLIKEPVIIAILKPGLEGLVIGRSVTSGNGKKSKFSWSIPRTIEQRNDYKISIRYTNNPASDPNKMIYDTSDRFFTIKNAQSSSSSKSSSSRSSSSKSRSSSSSATSTTFMLRVNKSGQGYVTDGGRINCGSKACQDTYLAGAKVELEAVPDGGYVFDKFSPEKECVSVYSSGFGFNDDKLIKQAFAYRELENVTCVTIMNKNKTITAIFKKTSSSSSSKSSKSSSSRSSSSKSRSSSSSIATSTNTSI